MSFVLNLKKVGFSDKKASVYLALLQNGKSTVRELVEHTKIRRTTIYDILNELIKSGLVAVSSGSGEKRTFVAEEPTRLAELVDERVKKMAEQKAKLEEQQLELKELIPQLKSLNDAAIGKPRTHFYEGAKGLVEALNDCLLKKQPIYIYGSVAPWRRWMSDHFEWYTAELSKRKIEVKRIEQKSLNKLRGMDPEESGIEWPVKYLPVGFNIDGFTLIYGDRLLLASFQKPTATIIEDKSFVTTQKTIFQVFWQFLRED